ncbi:class I SAM-dependent methyltransferase [Streptomyces sp. NPDC005385]|uniref:class I SAM-dependent methyltransferase n=1 Tax=Streptomyces sp. NPDC005385 TaxID=3157039 RepID=UPI0033A5031A
MAESLFEHPRMAAVYDALEPDRSDLVPYVAIAKELGARRVLDIGCGTGTFALLLADQGVEVTGVDPARSSIDVARAKQGGERVRWLCGDATNLPSMRVDLATITANVAQEIVEPQDWAGTLRGAYAALRPGGHLVFETRDPARRAWRGWNRLASYKVTQLQDGTSVRSWVEVMDIAESLVTFRWTYAFASDGQVLTSVSTLRFRGREEIEASLKADGFVLQDMRDAPDRPGREFVFIASRPR